MCSYHFWSKCQVNNLSGMDQDVLITLLEYTPGKYVVGVVWYGSRCAHSTSGVNDKVNSLSGMNLDVPIPLLDGLYLNLIMH